MQTRIHTIRHAKTAYGEQSRYAGTIDVPLCPKGIEEAKAAAAAIAALAPDVVVTSALMRSIETARIFIGEGVPVVESPLCNERNFGIMEGRTWDEVQTLDPPVLFIEVGGDRHSVNPRGGEPFEDVRARAKKFRSFLFRRWRGSTVLVISHGVFLQQLHGVFRGLSCIECLASYPSNLELNSFTFEGNRLVEHAVEKLTGAKGVQF